MIWFYSGTPGSGKSYHVAKDIWQKLKRGGNVIASFDIAVDNIPCGRKGFGKFTSVDLSTLSPDFFIDYAKQNHVFGKESQTLVVLDECQIIFNPREFTRKDRLSWITFFTQHRKLGYNFILISQFDRLVDKQIRSLFEYEVKHRKVNNFGIGMLAPVPVFACVTYWYGVREKISTDFIVFQKKYSLIYDTYLFLDESVKLEASPDKQPAQPACCGGVGGSPPPTGGLDSLIADSFPDFEDIPEPKTRDKIWDFVFKILGVDFDCLSN